MSTYKNYKNCLKAAFACLCMMAMAFAPQTTITVIMPQEYFNDLRRLRGNRDRAVEQIISFISPIEASDLAIYLGEEKLMMLRAAGENAAPVQQTMLAAPVQQAMLAAPPVHVELSAFLLMLCFNIGDDALINELLGHIREIGLERLSAESYETKAECIESLRSFVHGCVAPSSLALAIIGLGLCTTPQMHNPAVCLACSACTCASMNCIPVAWECFEALDGRGLCASSSRLVRAILTAARKRRDLRHQTEPTQQRIHATPPLAI